MVKNTEGLLVIWKELIFGSTSISLSCNKGSVISKEGCVGGIVGAANRQSSITSCYNIGSVNGTDQQYSTNIGGIVGRVVNNGTIRYTYNMGNVNSIRGFVGGIAGQNNASEVRNSYNAGNVTISSSTKPTNIIGAEANRYLGYVIGWNDAGTASNNVQNITATTLKGWSASTITTNLGNSFKKGTNYPLLDWES